MIQFDWPWALLALPVPWMARRLLAPAPPPHDAALRVPSLADFTAGGDAGRRMRRGARLPWLIAALAWLALVLSAMRPLWLGDVVELPVSGRDLLLAVDLSGSMEQEDFILRGRQVDRLTATRHVAGDFIERRAGDRIGLILFGEQAYLQAPLTFDRATVRTLLDESVIGLAGKATAIGDAIGLAVKRLREKKQGDRVLILLTDGANTAGAVAPLEAADLAAKEGLRIYTIGVGADAILLRDLFGARRVNPSADLDEDTLQEIARRTGGRYFRARDTQELENIYRLLDRLEPAAADPKYFRPQTTLFHWPLACALALGLALVPMRLRGAFQ
jgi:Ca-activated chloride channel family protein